MIEPWFPQESAAWLAYLSLFALAGVLEQYAKQGRHRSFVTSAYLVCAAIGVILSGAAIAATLLGQPWYVFFPLGFSGFIMSLVFASSLLKLRRQYTEAEMRRVAACDM